MEYARQGHTSGNWRAASRTLSSSFHTLAGDPQRFPPSGCTPRGSYDLDLVIAAVEIERMKHGYNLCKQTLCSITSFLATLSKYPSHILLNRSLMSCSTSSSSSFDKDGNAPFSASLVVVDDKVPGSDDVGICFVEGDVKPRYGREYDLRNVDRRGSDERVGSFES
jgi:hypothetical protein